MATYRKARTPALEDLDGKLSGRVLRIPVPRVMRLLERFSRSKLLPWRGKTFAYETADHGHGVNRWLGSGVDWLEFETSVGRSRAGDFDAVHLDYSLERNPRIARKLKSELREVGPGVWLGLEYWPMREGDRLITFLGLAREDTGER